MRTLNRPRFLALACALALLTAPVAPAPAAAPAADRVVGRFLGDRNDGIVYVDAAAVDLDQVEAAFSHAIKTALPDEKQREQPTKRVGTILATCRQLADTFKRAGGKDLYFLPPSSPYASEQRRPIYLLPLRLGADSEALASLFAGLTFTPAHAVTDNTLLLSDQATIDRLKAVPPAPDGAPQNDLLDALASSPAAQVRFAVRPADLQYNPVVHQAVENIWSGLTDFPFSAPEWRNVRYALFSLTILRGSETVNVTFHCTDESSAAKLKDLLRRHADDLIAGKNVGPIGPASAAKLARVINPRLQGPDVLITLSQDSLQNTIMPLFFTGQSSATSTPAQAQVPAQTPAQTQPQAPGRRPRHIPSNPLGRPPTSSAPNIPPPPSPPPPPIHPRPSR